MLFRSLVDGIKREVARQESPWRTHQRKLGGTPDTSNVEPP
jgi:hypothetical protein